MDTVINVRGARPSYDAKYEEKAMQNIALELGAHLVTAIALSNYMKTPVEKEALIIRSISFAALSGFTRLIQASLQRKMEAQSDILPIGRIEGKQTIALAFLQENDLVNHLEKAPPFLFTYNLGKYISVFIHEGGHSLMDALVFKTWNSRIELALIGSGITRWPWPMEYSSFGEALGEDTSLAATYLTGSALSVITSTGLLVASRKVKRKHPVLSEYLLYYSLLSITNEIVYAMSGDGDHLYADERGGVNHLFTTIAYVALPILALFAFTNTFNTKSKLH